MWFVVIGWRQRFMVRRQSVVRGRWQDSWSVVNSRSEGGGKNLCSMVRGRRQHSWSEDGPWSQTGRGQQLMNPRLVPGVVGRGSWRHSERSSGKELGALAAAAARMLWGTTHRQIAGMDTSRHLGLAGHVTCVSFCNTSYEAMAGSW